MAKKETITVKAELRAGRGKNDAGRLRREGKLPLTVYGGDGGPVAATAQLAELAAILRSETRQNTIFKLDIDGVGVSDVMFQDRQIDPVKGRLVHADLRRIVKGQKIEVTVEIELVGEPIGVKDEGGILEQTLRELEIECEPLDIPEKIEADVSGLGVHDALHVSDLKIPEGVKVLTQGETVIATVGIVSEEVEQPAGEVPAEPEVIGKGKKEEEEE
jgi:large subunit ribosomal protein L25